MSDYSHSNLEGSWEVIKSENLEAYLKKKKFNYAVRKMMEHTKPKMIITKTGEKKWKIKVVVNSLIQFEHEAEEGVEFIFSPPLGEKQKSVIRLDSKNPNLLHEESRTIGDESDLTICTREVIGEQLVMVSYGFSNFGLFKQFYILTVFFCLF